MSVFLQLLGTQSGIGGTDPCALGIPIGEVVRGHVCLHLRCPMRAIHVKAKPQCDLLAYLVPVTREISMGNYFMCDLMRKHCANYRR